MKNFFSWLQRLFFPTSTSQTSTKTLPSYIDFSNDLIVPLPGLGTHTLMYCFPLQGDYNKILNVCNQRLNFSALNQKTRFYPLTNYVILVVSDMQKAYTLDQSYTKYGYLSEKAVQVFIPVAECTPDSKGRWVAQRLLTFIPYIFIDNPISDSIGREHIGFPKNGARFSLPQSPETAHQFGIDAYGFQKFDRQNLQKADYYPWLTIQGQNTADLTARKRWQTTDEAWRAIKDTFERIPAQPEFSFGIDLVIHELEDLWKAEVPMVFLKQFRDITYPDKACYQAITQSNGIITSLHDGWFLPGPYELNFHRYDSFPITSDLGLPATISVNHAFWVDADLEFEKGQTLWSQSK